MAKFCHEETEATDKAVCPVMPFFQDAPRFCVGRHCMAWRWAETHILNPDDPTGDLVISHDTHGYCGMAGAPHQLFDRYRPTINRDVL